MSVDRCNTFSFPTILMMILKRHFYDYPIMDDNKCNHEKSVRKCIPSILTAYSLYRKSNLEWIVGVSGSVPEEILIYLDLFFLLGVDAPSVQASIFSRSRLFSFPLSLSLRRARSHIYIQTRCDEDERVWASISFYLKTRETLK